MRPVLTLLAAALVVAGPEAAANASLAGGRPDSQIAPRSVALLGEGRAALAAGKLVEAQQTLEAALAVDPRNRAAFVEMARVAMRQQRFGTAVRMTRKALNLEPTDVTALAVQGEAMVELGAETRAKDTLARIQKLCGVACPQATDLNSKIKRGAALAAAKPADAAPKN